MYVDVDSGAVKVDGAKGSPPSADYKVGQHFCFGWFKSVISI